MSEQEFTKPHKLGCEDCDAFRKENSRLGTELIMAQDRIRILESVRNKDIAVFVDLMIRIVKEAHVDCCR